MSRFRSIGTIRFRALLVLLLWIGAALVFTGILANVLQNVRTAQTPPSEPQRQESQGP